MRIVLNFLFDRLTDPLGLPIEVWEEYIVLSVIEIATYSIACAKVGELYQEGIITTRIGGSIVHWFIRAFQFLSIWVAAYCLIWIGKLIVKHWLVTTIISLIILCAGTAFIFIFPLQPKRCH